MACTAVAHADFSRNAACWTSYGHGHLGDTPRLFAGVRGVCAPGEPLQLRTGQHGWTRPLSSVFPFNNIQHKAFYRGKVGWPAPAGMLPTKALGRNHPVMQAPARLAVSCAQKAGHTWCLATGSIPSELPQAMRRLPDPMGKFFFLTDFSPWHESDEAAARFRGSPTLQHYRPRSGRWLGPAASARSSTRPSSGADCRPAPATLTRGLCS